MKYLPLVALAIICAIAVLAAPEAHALTFMPGDPGSIFLLAIGAGAIPVTSKKIRDLQAKAATLDARINELVDLEAASPAKAAHYFSERRKAMAEHSELQDAIEAETQLVSRDAGLNGRAVPLTEIDHHGRERNLITRSTSGGRRYAEMFPKESGSNSEFDGLGEFLRTVHGRLADPRLIQASKGGGEGVGTDGGFLVPTEFVADLMDASLEDEIVRPRALVKPMEYNSAFVAGFNTQDHSANIGGFTGVWINEGAQLAPQKGNLRAMTLNAQKLAILAAATNELLADGKFYDQELRDLLTKALGWYLDLAFLTGTGAGQPKGVLSDPALIVVNKEGGQAANTLQWANLAGMYERLHPACIKNAVWVFNQGTRKALLGLVQPVAITGAAIPPTQPVLKQQPNGTFTVLGLPAFFTEKVPAFSSQGDVLLADFSQYAVGLRKEMTLDVSQHIWFDSDETAFRAILRADGRGRWSQAVQPKNGATLSWCVTLQAR